jgi:tetratricopeptide (TPR) repeat protein
MKFKFLIVSFFALLSIASNAQSKAYLKEEADDYFKAGRYWDAFFLYRDVAKIPEFQGDLSVENQIKNSSHAMYLWKKTEDYAAFRKYDIAKKNLSELLVINPYDPNKGLLPRLTLAQANDMQRLAMSQRNPQATADVLAKAVQLYNQALNEGLKDEMVFSLIKQCENALEKNQYSTVKQPTTYGVNFEKEKEAARTRDIVIIKNL